MYRRAFLSVPLFLWDFLRIGGLSKVKFPYYGFLRGFGMLIMGPVTPAEVGGSGIVHSPNSLHPAACLCPLSLPIDCSPHEAKLISANCNAGRVAPLTPLLPPQPFSPSDTCGTHQGAPPRSPLPGAPHPSPAAAGLTADTRSCLFWAATYPGGHVPLPSEASHGQCLPW